MWFLCEGDELGDFCQGFDVECYYSVYDYWDDFDICFWCAMALKSLFKRLIDGVDVVYDFLYVFVGGVFAFNKLELSSSFVGMVFNEFAVGPKCVSYRLDEVRFVMCRSMSSRKCVFLDGVCWFCSVQFIVL